MNTILLLAAAAWTWDGGDSTPQYEPPPGLNLRMADGSLIPYAQEVVEALVVPLIPQQEPTMRVRALAGTLASLGSDAPSDTTPAVRVAVEAALAPARMAPHLHVGLDLTNLPGESVELGDPTTFKAIEADLALAQPVHPNAWFKVVGWVGFTTRLEGDLHPKERSPKYAGGGLLFQSDDRSAHLRVGVGTDQRLSNDGYWRPTVQVEGMVTVVSVKGVRLTLMGNAILGLNNQRGIHERSDLVRVGMAVGV